MQPPVPLLNPILCLVLTTPILPRKQTRVSLRVRPHYSLVTLLLHIGTSLAMDDPRVLTLQYLHSMFHIHTYSCSDVPPTLNLHRDDVM